MFDPKGMTPEMTPMFDPWVDPKGMTPMVDPKAMTPETTPMVDPKGTTADTPTPLGVGGPGGGAASTPPPPFLCPPILWVDPKGSALHLRPLLRGSDRWQHSVGGGSVGGGFKVRGGDKVPP